MRFFGVFPSLGESPSLPVSLPVVGSCRDAAPFDARARIEVDIVIADVVHSLCEGGAGDGGGLC